MNKKFYLFSVLAASALFMANLNSAHSSASGAIAARTGSPGDGDMNCGNSGCHPANTVTAETVSVKVLLPDGETTYQAGETYTVEVSGSKEGAVDVEKMGFEATVEDGSDNKIGTLASTNAETKIESTDYVTHTSDGTGTVFGNNRTWTFEWTAPNDFEGDATVYAAVLFADGSGNWTGDVTVTASETITVESAPGVGLDDINTFSYTVYPNPTTDLVKLQYNLEHTDQVRVTVMDMTGREIAELFQGEQAAGQYEPSFDLNLAKGNYLIGLQKGSRTYMNRLVVAD